MKSIKLFLAVVVAIVFSTSLNGQTVVRSLNSTNQEQDKTNPNGHIEQQNGQKDNSMYSFWGFGYGYVRKFNSGGGDGLNGYRIPLYVNRVGKNSPVGFFGLIGYEHNGADVDVLNIYGNKTKMEVKIHRIPILAHASISFGDRKTGAFLHGGMGLNYLAKGKGEYMIDPKNKKYETVTMDSKCDFTIGVGAGVIFKQSLMIHAGVNYALEKDHASDFDISIMFIF